MTDTREQTIRNGIKHKVFSKIFIILIIVIIGGILVMMRVNRSSSDDKRVFEQMESATYAMLSEQGLLQVVDKEVALDDYGNILIEDVYYDKTMIVMGIRINYVDEYRKKILPYVTYEGEGFNTSGARDIGKLADKYLLHVNLDEPLPIEAEVTLALQTMGSDIDVDVPLEISRSKTDPYVTSYRMMNLQKKASEEGSEVGILYEGPYGVTVEMSDEITDAYDASIGGVMIRNQTVVAYSAAQLSVNDGYIRAVFTRRVADKKLVPATTPLEIEFYEGGIDQAYIGKIRVELKQ